jgi:biopolymer transport protein ExbB
MNSFFELLKSGGLTMVPLVLCSIAAWAVMIERGLRYRKVSREQAPFQTATVNLLLRGGDLRDLRFHCEKHPELPLSHWALSAVDRLSSSDIELRQTWWNASERKRQSINLELRKNLWVLGTIASASPFIGLFGTVVGILQSFREMAEKGVGGFAVVAAGISEALIATAAGIIVAVIALMAFNTYQNLWNGLVLGLKLQTEELSEIFERTVARPDVAEQKQPHAGA